MPTSRLPCLAQQGSTLLKGPAYFDSVAPFHCAHAARAPARMLLFCDGSTSSSSALQLASQVVEDVLKLGRERQYAGSLCFLQKRGEWQDVWVAGTAGIQLAGADITRRTGKSTVVTVLGG